MGSNFGYITQVAQQYWDTHVDMDSTARIHIGRLAMSVLLSLILPMLVVIWVDYNLGLVPWLTIVASLILIPLASVIVIRTTLAEFDRVIELVAPPEPETPPDDELLEGVLKITTKTRSYEDV